MLTKKYIQKEIKEHSKPKLSETHKKHEAKETPTKKKEEEKVFHNLKNTKLYKKIVQSHK
jgi:hypothetical protein